MTGRQLQGEELLRQGESVFDPDFGDPPGLLWAHIVARANRLLALGTRLHIEDAMEQVERCLEVAKACNEL